MTRDDPLPPLVAEILEAEEPKPPTVEAAPDAAPLDEPHELSPEDEAAAAPTNPEVGDLLALLGDADPLTQLGALGYSVEELHANEASDPALLTPWADEFFAHQAHLFVEDSGVNFDVDNVLAEFDPPL